MMTIEIIRGRIILIKDTPEALIAKSSNLSEALDALVVLGYSRTEAQRALSGIDPSLDVTKIIPIALSKLMK